MRRIAPLLIICGLAGCNLQDLTPTSEVIRTRVAGVEAEPAEIGLGESTTLSSLLVHPPGGAPELGQIWFACLESEGATGCLGLDFESALGGDDDDDTAPPPDLTSGDFQFGIGERFTYTAEGELLDEAWAALEPAERVEGLTLLVAVNYVDRSNADLQQLLIQLGTALQTGDDATLGELTDELTGLMDGALTAARRVVISDKTAAAPAEVDCPATELLPNLNPSVSAILLHAAGEGKDSGFPLGPVTFVEPGTSLTLRPELSTDSREDYLFINRHDETECRREDPYFAWLVNGGASVRDDHSFVAEDGDLDEVAGRAKINRLHLPLAEEFPPQGIDLWLVVRDRRGGLAWLERRLLPFTKD